jgi:hypothetical protein
VKIHVGALPIGSKILVFIFLLSGTVHLVNPGVFTLIAWFGWPIIIFESLRDRYMLKRHKQLMKKVNVLSNKEYETEGTRLTRRGNLFRMVWVLWAVF